MATLTVFAWIFGAFVSVPLCYRLATLWWPDKEPRQRLAGAGLLHFPLGGIAYGLGSALYWDLYKETVTPDLDLRFTFLWALSFLGLSSLSSIVFRWWPRGSEDSVSTTATAVPATATLRLALEVLSLLASILGILSFYLNHLTG
jgi:hypothetical protein